MKKITKLFAVLALALMCLTLTACGGSTTKAELAPYLSVTYTGYNGNGEAHVDFDFSDFEYGIMSQWKDKEKNWEKLAVQYGISRSGIEKMRPAFSACYYQFGINHQMIHINFGEYVNVKIREVVEYDLIGDLI